MTLITGCSSLPQSGDSDLKETAARPSDRQPAVVPSPAVVPASLAPAPAATPLTSPTRSSTPDSFPEATREPGDAVIFNIFGAVNRVATVTYSTPQGVRVIRCNLPFSSDEYIAKPGERVQLSVTVDANSDTSNLMWEIGVMVERNREQIMDVPVNGNLSASVSFVVSKDGSNPQIQLGNPNWKSVKEGAQQDATVRGEVDRAMNR